MEPCPDCGGKKDRRAEHCTGCRGKHAVKEQRHGTTRSYWAGCRCVACKKANAEYAVLRAQEKPEMVRAEKRRSWARCKDRRNERRRKTNKARRLIAAATVKRELSLLGARLALLTDTEQFARTRFLVYALVDPRDISVRYVGVSSSGLGRPKQHGLTSHLKLGDNKRKDDWIKALHASGLTYAIRVLEYFESPEAAHAAEPYWIVWFRAQGEHLYNLTAGDDTKIRASEETKEKMRQKMLGRVITWGEKISTAKQYKNHARMC